METFETFMKLGSYRKQNLISEEPTCFNGKVSVRKYKHTVELIDEPLEVIQARIKKLWNECENHHHRQPLKAEARKYGLEL